MEKSTTENIDIYIHSAINATETRCEKLDMNLSMVFNIFDGQSFCERSIPFTINEGIPNKETVSAMLEAERIAKDATVKGYHDVDKFFADLDE